MSQENRDAGEYGKDQLSGMYNGINNRHIPVPCAPDDPRRCKAQARQGQCIYLAMPEGKGYCPIHGRTPSENGLYKIAMTEAAIRINEMRRHPDTYTLENELALIRILLEQVLAKCKDNNDLLINSGSMLELTDKIEKLLVSNLKIAEKTGAMLSIDRVVELAQKLIESVALELDSSYPKDHVCTGDNTVVLGTIAERFEALLNE